MDWRTAWFCVKCNGELTDYQVMYSHGRCRACGHKAEPGTIVAVSERAYRLRSAGRVWWKPWTWWRTEREYLTPNAALNGGTTDQMEATEVGPSV